MKPRKIIIVGGGAEGWSVAACLRAQLPSELVVIQLIETSYKNRYSVENTHSKIHRFHNLIGLQEKTCMFDPYTQFGLGVMYKSWNFDTQDFILSEEPYGVPYQGINFQHLYIKNALTDARDLFENYSLNAVAARLGRFVHPSPDETSIYSSIKYGLHLELESYAQLLKSHALALGVDLVAADCEAVQRDANNTIISLSLTTGKTITADLFFDCSGEARVLQQTNCGASCVQDDFDLLFDRVAIGSRPITDVLPSVTQLTTSEHGVFKIVPLKDREVVTAYFANRTIQEDNFKALLIEAGFQDIEVSNYCAYRTENTWVNNCIAVGLSSVQYPELLVSSLHNVRNSVVRFLDLLVDFDHIEASRDEYNRLSLLELERIRETLELHLFLAKDRLSVSSQYFSDYVLSAGAQARLDLFKANGRHPHNDENFLTDIEWAAFWLGNNVIPEACDYEASFVNDKNVQEFMSKLKSAVFNYATKMPSYKDYTTGLMKK